MRIVGSKYMSVFVCVVCVCVCVCVYLILICIQCRGRVASPSLWHDGCAAREEESVHAW